MIVFGSRIAAVGAEQSFRAWQLAGLDCLMNFRCSAADRPVGDRLRFVRTHGAQSGQALSVALISAFRAEKYLLRLLVMRDAARMATADPLPDGGAALDAGSYHAVALRRFTGPIGAAFSAPRVTRSMCSWRNSGMYPFAFHSATDGWVNPSA